MWRILNARLCWFVSNRLLIRRDGKSRWRRDFFFMPTLTFQDSWTSSDTLRRCCCRALNTQHTAVRLVLREAWTSQEWGNQRRPARFPFPLFSCYPEWMSIWLVAISEVCSKRVENEGLRDSSLQSGEREARSRSSSVGTSDSCVKHQKFFSPRLRWHKGKGAAAAEAVIIIILTMTTDSSSSRVASHPANET